ncbi:MAG TPA: cation transporter [Candidatus Hydrogenedentes bacterium]|nr:cation transporter [Candidatus Hydrogenedentota bacterium]
MFKQRKLRAATVSVACNLILVIPKLVGAHVSLSAAMKADALHSASDILISCPVFLSIWSTLRNQHKAAKPTLDGEDRDDTEAGPRDDHAGTANKLIAENLTALLVSVLLIAAAAGFLVRAFTGDAQPLRRVPIAIVIVWVCMVLSHFLARYKIRVGRDEGSISLEADGHHSRMDLYSSAVVFVGLLGDLIGIRLDALASALVSFLVLKAGGEVLFASIRGLAASEAFTYQSLAGLYDTPLGRKLAPV